MNKGIRIDGRVVSDFPVKDIDTNEFLTKFLEWIEDNGYQYYGTVTLYEYEAVKCIE